MFNEMPIAGSGGEQVVYDERVITCATTPTQYTIDTVTGIYYFVYYYGLDMFGAVIVDADGTVILNYDKFGGQYGGVSAVSGNQVTFNWNAVVSFTFKTVGYK
ncbi:MAG: hypothetical protein IIY21_03945 [Clostridiales bacterium]|nr:hypothetical protein [Clostridiales bacterium]